MSCVRLWTVFCLIPTNTKLPKAGSYTFEKVSELRYVDIPLASNNNLIRWLEF